jgi:nucleotide-binding universal stress UspA family protein
MYKHIIIPVALDHESDLGDTIATARMLQPEGGKITLVAVIEEVPNYVAEYSTIRPNSHVKEAVKERLSDFVARHPGIEIAVLIGKPGVVIPDLAEQTAADLIMIRSHRPGIEDYFLGSTASRVVRRAPCAVFVLR